MNTRTLGKEISREWTLGKLAGYETIKSRKLVRIEGPRSAWDWVSILHERDSTQGKLTVVTVERFEKNGKVIA